ncbi:MAG TPA: HAMP domain-containing sensor histidine kinase [Polyangiales bacterium]|jgi:signal transduction histidine kinase
MSALDGAILALAAISGEAARTRVAALEAERACVRVCVFGADLWSSLSEASFDLIVLLAEPSDPAARAIRNQLREHARTRDIPSLSVPIDLDDATFLATVLEQVAPRRALRESEARERELREQLRAELAQSEANARAAAELSHELRSSLDAVLGFACNLRDELPGPLSPDQRSHVEAILAAIDRSTTLLQRSSVSSRRPSLPAPLHSSLPPTRIQRTLVPLSALASEVCAGLAAVAARKRQHLICQGDETVFIWGDALKLKQLLTNLAVNGLKYGDARVTVSVRWSAPRADSGASARRSAELLVEDDGRGIPVEQRERIFQRGYRLREHAAIAGEGIGLAVVKDVVNQHGGSIRVHAADGGGALFIVSLPQDRRQRARTDEDRST